MHGISWNVETAAHATWAGYNHLRDDNKASLFTLNLTTAKVVNICKPFHLSIHSFAHPSHPYAQPHAHPSIHLSNRPFLSVSIKACTQHTFVHQIHTLIHPSFLPSIQSSIHQCMYLRIYSISIHPSTHPSIQPSIHSSVNISTLITIYPSINLNTSIYPNQTSPVLQL